MITEVSESGQASITGVRAPAYDARQLRGAGRAQWLDEFSGTASAGEALAIASET